MTAVLVLYCSSHGRVEDTALPVDLVSFATLANSVAAPPRLGAPLAEPERPRFYDGDRRSYPDYPSWHRMA
jgi:hypothetical protein